MRTPGRPRRPSFGVTLALLLAAGTLGRLLLAFGSYGDLYDMESLELARRALGDRPLEAFTALNPDGIGRWPYLSGFFGFVVAADWAAQATGLPYHGLVQMPSILADAGIAWVVQRLLGDRGADVRVRLAAAALVALGPSFVVVSGYHGQIDAVAILPALLALWAWLRLEPPRRALVAGLLVGAGASVKTMPVVLLLALLPTARGWGERATLVAATAVVPVLAVAPFLLAGHPPPLEAAAYRGLPGAGGLSLVAQPSLGAAVLGAGSSGYSGLTRALVDASGALALAGLAAAGLLLLRARADAVAAAVLTWLAVYVFGANFFFQYLVWGLPFFLAAGHVRAVAAAQALVLVPTLLFYTRPHGGLGTVVVYVLMMLTLWAAFAVAFARQALRLRAGPPAVP